MYLAMEKWKNMNHDIQFQNNLRKCPMLYLGRQKIPELVRLIYNPKVKCFFFFFLSLTIYGKIQKERDKLDIELLMS